MGRSVIKANFLRKQFLNVKVYTPTAVHKVHPCLYVDQRRGHRSNAVTYACRNELVDREREPVLDAARVS